MAPEFGLLECEPMNEMIQTLSVVALPLVLALTIPAAVQAYAARFFGDTTCQQQGRLTWNPARHIDPLGTVIYPLALIALQSRFVFGYPKPVPVQLREMRDPKTNMAWVSVAGLCASFAMAFAWLVFDHMLVAHHVTEAFFGRMAAAGVQINISLLALGMLPILPMGGGRIVYGLLPLKYATQFARVEPFAFILILLLGVTQVLDFWLVPVQSVVSSLLVILIHPLVAILQ